MPVSENGTEGVMSDGDLNGDELGGFLKRLEASTTVLARPACDSIRREAVHPYGTIAHDSKMGRCSLPRRRRPIGENAWGSALVAFSP